MAGFFRLLSFILLKNSHQDLSNEGKLYFEPTRYIEVKSLSCSNMAIFWQILDFDLLQKSQNKAWFWICPQRYYVKVLKRLIGATSSVPSISKDVLGWPKLHHKLWGEKKNYDNCLHIFHPFSPFDAPLYTYNARLLRFREILLPWIMR